MTNFQEALKVAYNLLATPNIKIDECKEILKDAQRIIDALKPLMVESE